MLRHYFLLTMKRTIISLTFLILMSGIGAQDVTWVSSTSGSEWGTHRGLRLTTPEQQPDIIISNDKKLQQIDGFGACFNELGWEALLSVPEAKRTEILRDLFSKEGMNFSWGRMPLGSNDYSLSYYSYDDVPEDFDMKNFNIDRDRYILIPYIRAAKKIRPDLKIWASPWAPPLWMKVNNHYAMGANTTVKRMLPGKTIQNNATAFRMEDAYLAAYGLYFSRFVQAYRKEGIDISLVMVQNEPVYQPHWPSCTWRPEDLAFFIGKFLGPQFERDSLATRIWLGTVNSGDPNFSRVILQNKEAAGYIKGIGMQWDAKWTIETVHKEFPVFPIMQTESECGNGENDWRAAEYTWSLVQRYLNNGANTYMYWNMVLDTTGTSTWGWKQNMLIAINTRTGEVQYNPEYYLMKHLSHFVQAGAHLLQTPGVKDLLAFENPDGAIIVVFMNLELEEKKIRIGLGGKALVVSAAGKSMNTLVIPPGR